MYHRRWLAVALVLICLLGVTPARADQGAVTSAFTDLAGHWAQDIVAGATAAGYVQGYPDGTFRPGTPVTRVELLKLIGAATGNEPHSAPVGADIFPDLGPGHWLVQQGYADPKTLRAAGDLWAVPAGQPLDANRQVRRWEMAALVAWVEVAGDLNPVEGNDALLRFPDLRGWEQPARAWVGLAAAHGLLGGYPDGTFRPEEPVTRVEAVVILERLRRSRWRQDPAGLLAAGAGHLLAIKPDGSVWGWGTNSAGSLGESTMTHLQPARIAGVTNPRAVAVGLSHSLALRDDGTVLAWGTNDEGQLGDGTLESRPTPAPVPGLDQVMAIAAGERHSLALRTDGTVWSWGFNYNGQLGDGSYISQNRPVQVVGLANVIAVASGEHHSLAIKSDGTVWSWGKRQAYWPNNPNLPVEITGLPPVRTVAAGGDQSLALADDGSVWQWGTNGCTQVWTPTPWKPEQVPSLGDVVAVAAGRCHGAALKADGTVWTWGFNEAGQLGDGTVNDRREPVQVQGLTAVRALYAAQDYTLAVTQTGALWAWGDYKFGFHGFNAAFPSPSDPALVPGVPPATAVAAGSEYSLALTKAGQVYVWGALNYFRSGYRWRRSAAPIPDLPPARAVAAGSDHALILLQDGTIAAFGSNQQGEVGDGSTQWVHAPSIVTDLSDITAAAAGKHFSLALKADGKVWAFGQNDLGQLGDGSHERRTKPVLVKGVTDIIAVVAGEAHALALQRNGTVWAWGDNQYGQLGNGDTTASATPIRVDGLGKVFAIAATATGSVVLTENGEVWTWGEAVLRPDRSYGGKPVRVEGIPPLTTITAGGNHEQFFAGVTADGRHYEWRWFSMDDWKYMSKPAVNTTLQAFVTVARGDAHTLGVKPDGSVWAWGVNDRDSLGLMQTTPVLASDLNLGPGRRP